MLDDNLTGVSGVLFVQGAVLRMGNGGAEEGNVTCMWLGVVRCGQLDPQRQEGEGMEAMLALMQRDDSFLGVAIHQLKHGHFGVRFQTFLVGKQSVVPLEQHFVTR